MSDETEIADLQSTIRTDPETYWKHGGPERMSELLAQRDDEGGTLEPSASTSPGKDHLQPSPAVGDSSALSIDQIRGIMREDYPRYCQDKGMQARLAELCGMEGEEAEAVSPEGIRPTEDDVQAAQSTLERLGEVGSEWIEEAGDNFNDQLEVMEDARQKIVAELGETADEIITAFAGLNGNAQSAFYRELGTGVAPRDLPGDDDQLAQFKETSAGQILAQEWGSESGERLARVMHRWDRLTENMPEADFDDLNDFFRNRLKPDERAAVMRVLST